ncbi:ComEC/Rec2 family competence protein [Phaeovulum vinaykumarii]|nr:ComEC/Rec2 family competence protein [Phaeovulum vinaykumarii]
MPPRRGWGHALTRLGRAAFDGLGQPGAALGAALADLVLWLPVFLALGIGLYFAAPFEPGPALRSALSGVLILGVGLGVRAPPALRFLGAGLAVVALGVLLGGWRAGQVAAPVLEGRFYGAVEGRIVGIDRSSRDLMRLTLDQLRLERVAPARTPARVRISLHGDQTRLQPVPGMRVMATAHLTPPPGPAAPGAFDFRRHAFFDRLGAVGYTRVPVMRVAPPEPGGWGLRVHRTRHALAQAIRARIPGQPGAMAAALLTGDRSGLSEATNAVLRASNLYHVIAISGLHMGLVVGFVFGLVRYGLALAGRAALIWPTKKIAAAIALVAASFYLVLAGPSVATQRAYVMAVVMLVAVLIDRRALSLRSVAVAALVILVIAPEALTGPGFQMSFAATVALIVVLAPWSRVQARLPVLLRPVAGIVMASLAAGLVTAPLAAAHFNRMAEYGLLANLLAVPVMGVLVMPAGVLAAVLAPLGLAEPALWLMGQGTAWMLGVARFVAGLEGAVTALPAPPGAVLPCLGLGAVTAVLGRGVARSAGLVLAGGAFVLWAGAARPPLLIAPEAEQVGLMTPAGRVLSRDGAGFVSESWLEADGDVASVSEAAARPGFTGPKGARRAVFAGRALVHLTGRQAPDRLPEVCRDGALVVLAAPAPAQGPGDCVVIDRDLLRRTGALALWPYAGGLGSLSGPMSGPISGRRAASVPGVGITSATEVAGRRPWTTPERPASERSLPR